MRHCRWLLSSLLDPVSSYCLHNSRSCVLAASVALSIASKSMIGLNTSFNSVPAKFMMMSSDSAQLEGSLMVVSEMSLSLLAIVLNLVVLISIRNREHLLTNTTNLMLANVSLSNLVSAVFVKSIAVIYNGYAVAKQIWQVQLAFCTLHTVAFRTTWAVFPYTLVALSLHSLSARLLSACPGQEMRENDVAMTNMASSSRSLETSFDSHLSGVVADDEDEENNADDDEDFSEGPTSSQKGWLASIWLASLMYSTLSEQVLSKERIVPCPLRHDLDKQLNLVSLITVLILPALLLLLFLPLANCLVLVATGICCRPCWGSDRVDVNNNNEDTNNEFGNEDNLSKRAPRKRTATTSARSVSAQSSTLGLQVCLVLTFLLVYPTHMVLPELALDNFAFMMTKYVLGTAHLVIVPIVVLVARRDVRKAAIEVALGRSRQGSSSN